MGERRRDAAAVGVVIAADDVAPPVRWNVLIALLLLLLFTLVRVVSDTARSCITMSST